MSTRTTRTGRTGKDRRITRNLGLPRGSYDKCDANGKGALSNLVYYYQYYLSTAERKQRAKQIVARSRQRQGIPEEAPKKPRTVKGILAAMRKRPEMLEGKQALEERAGEFDSPEQLELAGIAMHPPARAHFDAELDRMWSENEAPKRSQEVIIGAGFHAAVYCAVRVAMGKPRPLVIDRGRVGGTFAISQRPSFYLNSRNRPGELGIPGRGEALNVIPGAPIQPAHLSGDEYQRNSDLAFAIRCTLAMYARVVTGVEIKQVSRGYGYGFGAFLVAEEMPNYRVNAATALTRYTTRLIYATGLGQEARPTIKSERVMTFSQFMARMDERFPLRGMKRVAVVGAGDAGKTAVEVLVGQGPSQGMSTAALDHPERVDWFGVPAECATKDRWKDQTRSRYAGIARYLPTGNGTRDRRNPPRVQPQEGQVLQVAESYEGIRVNGRPYDHVIWCTGYESNPLVAVNDYSTVNGRSVAGRMSQRQYVIGPAASLPMDQYETEALPANLPENAVALFRYAERTATFAANAEAIEGR